MKLNPFSFSAGRRRGALIIVSSTVVLLVTYCVFVVFGPDRPGDGELSAARGHLLAEQGDLEAAFAWFRDQAEADPQLPKHHFEAARLAERIAQSQAAKRHAIAAWENGFRTRESCALLIRTTLENVSGDEFLERSFALFELLPDDQQDRELEADLKLRGGQLDEAIADWKQLAREDPAPALLDKLVGTLVHQDRADEAWDYMNSIWEDGVELDDHAFALVAILAAARSAEDLDDLCRDVRRLSKDGPQFRMTHALLRLSMNQVPKARLLLESVAEQRVSDRPDLKASARLFIGFLSLVEGDRNAIRELLDVVRALPPTAMSEGETLWNELLLETIDGTATASIRRMRQILQVTGEHPAVRLLLAQSLARAGAHTQAATEFRAISGIAAEWTPVRLGLAATLFHQREDLEALGILAQLRAQGLQTEASEKLRNLIGESNALWFEPGEGAESIKPALDAIADGQPEPARALLQAEIQSSPAAARLLAQLELMAGDSTAAIAAMQVAAQHSDKSLGLGDWAILGATADRHEHWRAAEFAYARALVLEPNEVVLKNNWASAKLKCADLTATESLEVLEVCRENHAAHPEDLVILQTLAECLVSMGKTGECAELLSARRRQFDDQPTVLLRLGLVCAGGGDAQTALELLKRCRELQGAQEYWQLPIPRAELDQQIESLEAA